MQSIDFWKLLFNEVHFEQNTSIFGKYMCGVYILAKVIDNFIVEKLKY